MNEMTESNGCRAGDCATPQVSVEKRPAASGGPALYCLVAARNLMPSILRPCSWCFVALLFVAPPAMMSARETARPNILFCLGDNFSWPHLAPYGCGAIRTPNFDRVAREGVLFRNAFCCAPSCSPSRGGILTGQDIWRLEEGGNLRGSLAAKFAVYPDLLEQAGYWVGYTGKGWSPASVEAGGRKRNPAGDKFANFREFLRQKSPAQPFCFWYGDMYSSPAGKPVVKEGVNLEGFRIPAFLPDAEVTRNDFYYYFQRLRHLDAAMGDMLAVLESMGQLANTLIVYTADNGMDFPRGYPNLYDYGTHMFMAVRWGDRVKGGRTVDDFVNLIDLAPTFLEAAGLPVTSAMTGRSLMTILASAASGRIEPARDRVFTARERHAWARRGGFGYPMRAIRTEDFLLIRNYEPDRWPAGDPDFAHPGQGIYGDIDRCDTKTYIYEHRNDPAMRPLFELSFGKRPAEELYDLRTDPDQIHNVAGRAEYREAQRKLAADLTRHLRETGDPRALGKPARWDGYPYHANYRDKLQ
jgi:N-sulfoglucosamine sulfohydrolase